MLPLHTLLLLLALVSFLIAAFIPSPRVQFTALGLFFLTLALVLLGHL